jgi:glycosyltransferase involved in cell wall biosynthesis
MIDFIIPSIGRETLPESLHSLIEQTNPNWRAFVGFDGMSESQVNKSILVEDSRINYFFLKDKLGVSAQHGNAGQVRNKIISLIDSPSPWLGFLDDDDKLSKFYVEILANEIFKEENDCYVFRMNHNGTIIPPFHVNTLIQNYVGISFCLKADLISSYGITFENDNAEDFKFLMKVTSCTNKVKILPYVTYFVG